MMKKRERKANPRNEPAAAGSRTQGFRLAERPTLDPVRRSLYKLMKGAIERFLYLDQLEAVYRAVQEAMEQGEDDFLEGALGVLNVAIDIPVGDMERVPAEGPVMVVSNHPFGGIEGVVLLVLMRRIRPDVKVLANFMLSRLPEMDPFSIYVDPFEGKDASRRNLRPMKEALSWLGAGHMLLAFPAGEVSHLTLQNRLVMDSPWNSTIAGLVRRVQAPVMPVFFDGRNGNLFQLLGLVHPRIRTAMLPYETCNKKNSMITVRFGRLIRYARLERFESDERRIEYLKFRTYLLSQRLYQRKASRRRLKMSKRDRAHPIVPPQPPDELCTEIDALPADCLMIEKGDFQVYMASAEQIPKTLKEIGRLRETTFREEGEGTGKPMDIDSYDKHYSHLFMWQRADKRIVGAYRIAFTDKVVDRYGKRGLYTSSLFRYHSSLLRKMGPSLELGRSFICRDYQRNYTSLLLIWKGIAQIIIRYPRYASMFGPVSINNHYSSVSRQLMAAFLKMNNWEPDLARMIRPRRPLRNKPLKKIDPGVYSFAALDTDDISDIIEELERGERGIPILLKQYLRLNGRLLAFNVDPDFSDVLDGLIWVDLRHTDRGILERFMGKDKALGFLRYHGLIAEDMPEEGGSPVEEV